MSFGSLTVPCTSAPTPYYDELSKMARIPTIKERCELAVKQAEDRLAAVKRAREILDKHPDIEELLNIMQSSNF